MSEEENQLELDVDEAQHAALVSGQNELRIRLANDAAILTLSGLVAMEPVLAMNDRRTLVALLLAKSAQNVRFACKGLMLGYYPGAYAALRSALEGLEYAVLFGSRGGEHEVAKWLQMHLSSNPDVEQRQAAQSKAAKRALLDSEKDPHAINEGMASFWRTANDHIHATLEGLAKQFGIEVSSFIPGELDEQFVKTGGDLEKSLSVYVMLSKYGKSIAGSSVANAEGETDEIRLELFSRFDADVLDDVSMFAFYIAHRLLDTVNVQFGIKDHDWQQEHKEWHKELARLGE